MNLNVDDQIDVKWGQLSSKYPLPAPIMLAVLAIPHGNDDSERVFSTARHVDTDFRQKMDMSLLEALIVVKRDLLVKNEKCYTYNFTEDFLIRAKSAT